MTSTDRPAGPRKTRQRDAIARAVGKLPRFATAQEVHDLLRHSGSIVGLATVYRTLQAMTASGELDTIRTPDGQIAYRICSPGHHHHLICRACGRTVEVSLPSMESQVRAIATEEGFAEVDHELEFFGTCGACANRNGTIHSAGTEDRHAAT